MAAWVPGASSSFASKRRGVPRKPSSGPARREPWSSQRTEPLRGSYAARASGKGIIRAGGDMNKSRTYAKTSEDAFSPDLADVPGGPLKFHGPAHPDQVHRRLHPHRPPD